MSDIASKIPESVTLGPDAQANSVKNSQLFKSSVPRRPFLMRASVPIAGAVDDYSSSGAARLGQRLSPCMGCLTLNMKRVSFNSGYRTMEHGIQGHKIHTISLASATPSALKLPTQGLTIFG